MKLKKQHDISVDAASQFAWLTDDWGMLGGSVQGKAHWKLHQMRQDAFASMYFSPWFITALADGVGSKPLSREGAAIAVQYCVQRIAQKIRSAPALLDDAALRACIRSGLKAAQRKLCDEAQLRRCDLFDLGTTLLVAVAELKESYISRIGTAQIGDGAIDLFYETPQDKFIRQNLPVYYQTDFANHTIIIQDISDDILDDFIVVNTFNESPIALALMSDGLADDFEEKIPLFLVNLCNRVQSCSTLEEKKQGVLITLDYTMAGSLYDDRTIVLLYRRNLISPSS
jgi:serine/threonine protein phosphatase PrpC